MNETYFFAFILAYVFFSLVTFGYLYRNGEGGLKKRVRYLVAAAIWPVYWLVFQGVRATLTQITTAAMPLIDMVIYVWIIGIFFFPAYYIGTRYEECSAILCLNIIAKSIAWAIFWPVYFLTSINH